MELVDIFPSKGTFHPGEPVELWADLDGTAQPGSRLEVSIWHLSRRRDQLSIPLARGPSSTRFPVHWRPPADAGQGYGVEAELRGPDGSPIARRTTAFDVLDRWTDFPRYGFLSDFQPGREDLDLVFDELRRFHINGLQFYDWQYRHDRLIPGDREYDDPLGRPLSRDTLEACLARAKQAGMASMAYAAVYAASSGYWSQHRQAALYDRDGQPVPFGEDFLGLMNPAPGGAWANHLQAEIDHVLDELDFDGIHLDQYGEPREGFDARGAPVDLPAAFVEFIRELRVRHQGAPLAFNAVSGWPLDDLAPAPLDFLYVEIWPPMVEYAGVADLIRQGRALAPDKSVVVACYLPPESAANLLILNALSYSLGGSRIEIGEAGRLLSDPYFPKHQAMPHDLGARLRAYYDFAVRYGELLGPRAATLDEPEPDLPQGVWTFARRSPGWLALSLINLEGIDQPRWDVAHDFPGSIEPLTLQLPAPDGTIQEIWFASPDRGDPAMVTAGWGVERGQLQIAVPHLDTWSLIAIEIEADWHPT